MTHSDSWRHCASAAPMKMFISRWVVGLGKEGLVLTDIFAGARHDRVSVEGALSGIYTWVWNKLGIRTSTASTYLVSVNASQAFLSMGTSREVSRDFFPSMAAIENRSLTEPCFKLLVGTISQHINWALTLPINYLTSHQNGHWRLQCRSKIYDTLF